MIFFDAAGTLIEVKGRVGDIYAGMADSYGIALDPSVLQSAFVSAFRRQPPMVCPRGLTEDELARCEREWWRRLVAEVAGEASRHPRFDEYFISLFEYFRLPGAWTVYPEVEGVLDELERRGKRLAIISNFDSRLEELLAGLGLRGYFDAVHLSTRIGAAKPDPAIFRAALDHHAIPASEAIHVGDSLREDVEGASAAGLGAIWLDRASVSSQNDRLSRGTRITRLNDILGLIP